MSFAHKSRVQTSKFPTNSGMKDGRESQLLVVNDPKYDCGIIITNHTL